MKKSSPPPQCVISKKRRASRPPPPTLDKAFGEIDLIDLKDKDSPDSSKLYALAGDVGDGNEPDYVDTGMHTDTNSGDPYPGGDHGDTFFHTSGVYD